MSLVLSAGHRRIAPAILDATAPADLTATALVRQLSWSWAVQEGKVAVQSAQWTSAVTVKREKVTTNPQLSYQAENSTVFQTVFPVIRQKVSLFRCKIKFAPTLWICAPIWHQYRRGGPDFEDFPALCPVKLRLPFQQGGIRSPQKYVELIA
jgi:hypothetical protein